MDMHNFFLGGCFVMQLCLHATVPMRLRAERSALRKKEQRSCSFQSCCPLMAFDGWNLGAANRGWLTGFLMDLLFGYTSLKVSSADTYLRTGWEWKGLPVCSTMVVFESLMNYWVPSARCLLLSCDESECPNSHHACGQNVHMLMLLPTICDFLAIKQQSTNTGAVNNYLPWLLLTLNCINVTERLDK